MVILSHKGYSTIMNGRTVSRNREIRGRSGIGLGGGGRQWDQAVGSKVTKRDVFHSEIYYNTTEAPEGRAWGHGSAEAGVFPAPAASPGQRKGL